MKRIHIFHKWVEAPIKMAMRKRGVTGHRFCQICGLTQIRKPWYRRKWEANGMAFAKYPIVGSE